MNTTMIPQNNHLDLKLYDNICEEVKEQYPHLSQYHLKSIVEERYAKLGDKFRNDKQIDNMSNYVTNLIKTKHKETPTMTSIDLVEKFGRRKYVALKMCKEIDPNGTIDWRNGRFIESGDIPRMV